MSGSAQIVFDSGGKVALSTGDEQSLPENQRFALHGLDPCSPLGIRLVGEDRYRDLAQADPSGNAASTHGRTLPQLLGIASRGGETFEIRCYAGGRPVEFLLEVTHNLYDAAQIEAMLEDLRSMEYAWDSRSPVPTRVADLEKRVRAMAVSYPSATASAREIFKRPDEVLVHEQRSVPLREARRMSARDVRTNLARRTLDAAGAPVSATVVATVDVASEDTAANAYAVDRLDRANAHLEGLARQLDLEDRRLVREAERERRYRGKADGRGASETSISHLRERVRALSGALDGLSREAVPCGWRALRARPNASANMVRFDPRFIRLTRATAAMSRYEAGGTGSRLQRIAEFGRRAHSEIFEIWAVAKTVEALYRLGFRAGGAEGFGDHPEAFVQLEDPDGATYGLRSGASVALQHKDASHLYVRVGYEPSVRDKPRKRDLTPDIMMVLRGSAQASGRQPASFVHERYGTDPLYLDAKFSVKDYVDGSRAKGPLQKYLGLGKGASGLRARRPHSFLVQARGTPFTWSQRRDVDDDRAARALGFEGSMAAETLYPYRAGVATVAPYVVTEDAAVADGPMHPLVRIIYAWLITQGVVAVCPRCGSGMEPGRLEGWERAKHNAYKPYVPSSGAADVLPKPAKRHLECRTCDLGVTVNFCGSCAKEQIFVPIVKMYRHAAHPDEASKPAWIRDYEVAEPTMRHQIRHCPRCGA